MKRGFVLLVSLLIISLLVFVSAQELQLTSDLNVISYDVSENLIVFSAIDPSIKLEPTPCLETDGGECTATTGDVVSPSPDIYIYDLISNEQTKIGKGSYSILYENRYIVFIDSEYGDLVLYDLEAAAPSSLGIIAEKTKWLSPQMCSVTSNILFCVEIFIFNNEFCPQKNYKFLQSFDSQYIYKHLHFPRHAGHNF